MNFKEAPGDKYHDFLFRTSIGPAVWPHLLTPDTRFDDKGKYKIGIELTADETRAAQEAMTGIFRNAFPDITGAPHLPFKEAEGRTFLVCKSTYRPKLLTPERKEITEPLLVRHGHRVRVTGRVRAFRNKIVKGLACYLSAVEIHEPLDQLETYRLDAVTEGAFLATPRAPTPTPSTTFEDDLPF